MEMAMAMAICCLWQPRFKENSTWQILQIEVTTTRGLAWTIFFRSLSKTHLQEANFF
jgi:hypothetical protein